MLKLRDYQGEGAIDIRSSYIKGKRYPVYVLPTGAGKTVLFCHIAKEAAARGKRVMILVHRVELLRQTSKALTTSEVHHGLISPKYTPDLIANVQVASVQTLVRRLDKVIPPDLIIIDECHHGNAGSYKKIIDYYNDSRLLGVTATPIRGDGKGLGDIFDDLVIGPQIGWLIEQGYLVQPKLFGSPEPIDLSAVRTLRGDYNKDETIEIMDKPTITGSAVTEYSKLCPGSPAVVFCISVKHAENVAEEFRSAGYRSYSVDGSMDDETRTRILDGLGNGSVQVVTSCDLISEGTDIPAIVCAIKLRPTKSTGLDIQQGGRALRPVYALGYDLSTQSGRLAAIANSNKPHAIILDHVGNFRLHGHIDQSREWSLKGREKTTRISSSEMSIRSNQCDHCYAVFEPARICPYCGFENDSYERHLLIIDGELEEIDKKEQKRVEKVMKRTRISKANTMEELLIIQNDLGYKNGWAKHLFESRNAKLLK